MRCIIIKFHQLKALSPDDWKVILISALMLPLTAITLNMKGYQWTRNLLRKWIPKRSTNFSPEEDQLKEAQRVAKMVSVAASHGAYRANCLKKSLVIWWLLARRGIPTELRIGVNKDSLDFKAHAWVEFRGMNTLNDGMKESFYRVIF